MNLMCLKPLSKWSVLCFPSVAKPIQQTSGTTKIYSKREFHDRSQVPRVVDDREKKMHKVHDMGYYYRYHRRGVDSLPRIPDCREPLYKPKYKVREPWSETQAHFGANDYIDLLGDRKSKIHPAQLQYHVPMWLRGFPGQHRANELVKLVHYRNMYKSKLERSSPHRWFHLNKRINYLLTYHNYVKQDELRDERSLAQVAKNLTATRAVVDCGRFKLQQAREDKELAELIEEIDLEQQEENVENDSNVSLECY
uniref:Large ribosomal subunit protein mL51 n=1 Tax=Ditylenchus dipsaci TaxID=166011 RepID=A0A915E8P3_9BILA